MAYPIPVHDYTRIACQQQKVLIMIFICPCKNLNKLSISNKYGKIWDKAVDSFGDSVSNRDVGVFVNNLVSVGSNVANMGFEFRHFGYVEALTSLNELNSLH